MASNPHGTWSAGTGWSSAQSTGSWSHLTPSPGGAPSSQRGWDDLSSQGASSYNSHYDPAGGVEMGYMGATHQPTQHPPQPYRDPSPSGPQAYHDQHHQRQHRGYDRLRDDQFPLQATPQSDTGYLSPMDPKNSKGYIHVGPAAPEIRPSTAGPSKFKRFLKSQWAMMLCFLFGAACAGGHHIFYSTLDGKQANNQLVMQRYGTLIAFGAKAGLSASVIIAYRQRVWVTARKRLMTVGALDSLFALTGTLSSLFSWEMIKNSKIAVLLGVFVW